MKLDSAARRAAQCEALRGFRFVRGMTQADAARWYGVDLRTWRRWERGEVPLPLHADLRIAEAVREAARQDA